ncbi:protein regulator of cytokinesis 1 isoform X2 [Scaptodrosophila lebanonensis]|uniref:Protein regulator of cytokinesis 1 isoform X2 n=1 Tax=Drosophila lebanonensis TaxID=7225 RepID=A0A6J2TR20_DROLE|nr:protein regulator of cytokinesis 1 isoform X2 [Scaptodrosophila lebanonensis]
MSESKLKNKILEMTAEQVDRLCELWARMFGPETREAYLEKLNSHACSIFNDVFKESEERLNIYESEISTLRNEAADVMRLLNKTIDIGEKPAGMPLSIWQTKLDESIQHLRAELQERRAEICELLLQQEVLCDELDEPPLPLLADPLPKAEEMDEFRNHLERLRAERDSRTDELYKLRDEIKQDMKLLELLPQTDAEERLLNQPNHNLTPDTFNALRKLKKTYGEEVEELRTRIEDMRGKIHVLWERLQETDESVMRPVREAIDYTRTTYEILNTELKRCQALRRQNLKTYIEQLRVEIKDWWDLTLKSEQERDRFYDYKNNWYSEVLLELHELELDDLKTYYNNNKELFELFARRAELWERMEALEAKAKEPNRYNNRGGQLLKEERERKTITAKLPKIEQQITELVHAYVEREHHPFLVHGENILERMANDWEQRRQVKEQQSSARKQNSNATPSTVGKMLPPPAPGSAIQRTPISLKNMSAMSSSTMSLRKTPSQTHLNTNMSAVGAKTTGNLHKRKFPMAPEGPKQSQTPLAKRSLLSKLNSLKGSTNSLRNPTERLVATHQQKACKSPVRKVRILADTMRRSGGLGRRSAGGSSSASKRPLKTKRPVSKLVMPRIHVEFATDDSDTANDENKDNGNIGFDAAAVEEDRNDTYERFEKCVETAAARSSVLPVRPVQQQEELKALQQSSLDGGAR